MVRIPRDFVDPGSIPAGTINVQVDPGAASQLGSAMMEAANIRADAFNKASNELNQQMQQYQEEQGKNYYYANILGMQEQNQKALMDAQKEAGPGGTGMVDLYKQKMQEYIDPILQNAPNSHSRDQLMNKYVSLYGSSVGHALQQQAQLGLYQSQQEVMKGVNSQIYQIQQDAAKDLDSVLPRVQSVMEAVNGMSTAGMSPAQVAKQRDSVQSHMTMTALMSGATTQPMKAMDYANRLALEGGLTAEQANAIYIQANKAIADKAKKDADQLTAAKGIELYNGGYAPGEGLAQKGVEMAIQKIFTDPQPDGKSWAERPLYQTADKFLGVVRGNSQYFPEYAKGVLLSTLNNPKADPRDIASAANVINTLESDKNMAALTAKTFSAEDRVKAAYIADYMKLNNDPVTALNMANQTLAKPAGLNAESVAAKISEAAPAIKDFSASTERANWFSQKTGIGGITPEVKANDYYDRAARMLIESNMKQGHSFDVAKRLATATLDNKFSVSEVNGIKELVQNPIEQVTKMDAKKVRLDVLEGLGLIKNTGAFPEVTVPGITGMQTVKRDVREEDLSAEKLKALGVPMTDYPTPGGHALANNSNYKLDIVEANKDPVTKNGQKLFFYNVKFTDELGNEFTMPKSLAIAQQALDPESKKENDKVKFLAESLRESKNAVINRVKNLQTLISPKAQKIIDTIWSD